MRSFVMMKASFAKGLEVSQLRSAFDKAFEAKDGEGMDGYAKEKVKRNREKTIESDRGMLNNEG